MNNSNILDKFTDRETISYAEFIRRLPNCPTFAEVLLEIPHRIEADSFNVEKYTYEHVVTLKQSDGPESDSSIGAVFSGKSDNAITLRPVNDSEDGRSVVVVFYSTDDKEKGKSKGGVRRIIINTPVYDHNGELLFFDDMCVEDARA